MNISEFAKEIGVSTTTVSRAISGRGRISPQTRQMVLLRMQEHGYTPNLNAQRLVTGRAYTVALDWRTEPSQSLLGDMYLAQLIEGIQKALQQRGYGLLLNASEGNNTLRRWVASHAVDGVVVIGGGEGTEDQRIARTIADAEVPCVVIGHHPLPRQDRVGSVAINLQNGAAQVARMLVAKGHRRIGFIASAWPGSVLTGFAEELTRLGAPLDPSLLIRAGHRPEEGEQAMYALLDHPEPPSAVFVRTDVLAAGAFRAARRRGVSIPEDISLVGHDDVAFAALAEPPLTTVRIDCARLGEEAIAILFYLMEHPEACPQPSVVPTYLVERESVSARAVVQEPL